MAKPAQPVGSEAPVNAAITGTDAAITKADQKHLEQRDAIIRVAGLIRAEVEDAQAANQDNPPGINRTVVDLNLQVVTNYLKGIPSDPLELEIAHQRRQNFTTGDTTNGLAKYRMSMTNADAASLSLGKLDQEMFQLRLDRDTARQNERLATQKYISDAKAAQFSNQAEIDKLEKKLTDQIRNKQVWILTIAGIALLALFGLGLGFGGVAGAKIAWPLGVIGLLCLGLAQLVSQPWFMWACLAVFIAGLGLAAWWIWSHYQLGNLKQSLEVKSTQLQGALGDVIPVLDHAYEKSDQMTKDFLDNIIFNKLAERMDKSTKGVIHQVRADIAETPPP